MIVPGYAAEDSMPAYWAIRRVKAADLHVEVGKWNAMWNDKSNHNKSVIKFPPAFNCKRTKASQTITVAGTVGEGGHGVPSFPRNIKSIQVVEVDAITNHKPIDPGTELIIEVPSDKQSHKSTAAAANKWHASLC